jgi:hypothetical protein
METTAPVEEIELSPLPDCIACGENNWLAVRTSTHIRDFTTTGDLVMTRSAKRTREVDPTWAVVCGSCREVNSRLNVVHEGGYHRIR